MRSPARHWHRLHQRGKWLSQSVILAEGKSLRQVARQLNIALSTAHRWRHRFLRRPGVERIAALQGIAEADETYFLHSSKGQRRLNRRARHRGGKASYRGLAPDLVPVLVARDRAGQTANLILPSTRAADMAGALRPLLPSDTILCTDGSSALAAAARSLNIEHHANQCGSGLPGQRRMAHSERQCLRQPTQALDASLQGRRNALSCQLSRLVPCP